MNLLEKIFISIIVVLVAMLIFIVFVECNVPKEYKYINISGEWGVSSKCFLDKQSAVCEIDGALEIVRQFYYEQ